jgi:hypothetical protein
MLYSNILRCVCWSGGVGGGYDDDDDQDNDLSRKMDVMVAICTRDGPYCVEIQCLKASETVFWAAERICEEGLVHV